MLNQMNLKDFPFLKEDLKFLGINKVKQDIEQLNKKATVKVIADQADFILLAPQKREYEYILKKTDGFSILHTSDKNGMQAIYLFEKSTNALVEDMLKQWFCSTRK